MPEDQSSKLATAIQFRQWPNISLIPGLKRQGQMDLCEFKFILCYMRVKQSKRETELKSLIPALRR